MAVDFIYIHLDMISNSVFSKGLTITDFMLSVPEKPQNILLLEPNAIEGEFEPRTGLKVIRGRSQMIHYFNLPKNKKDVQLKWIDFKDIHFLQQLTPMEIAELLYFSHMTSQLHSPFFYKLQNNFVYFEKPDDLAKVYYRHLDDFYHVVSDKLQKNVFEKVNQRKSLFKSAVPVAEMPVSLVKDLRGIFQEGIVLDFRQASQGEEVYQLPIYVVEDQVKSIETKRFKMEERIALISYNTVTSEWTLEQEEWDFLPNLKQV